MTMAVVFDALKSGRIRVNDVFRVSETAWRIGGAGSSGSTMFATIGSAIKVADLMRGVIVQGGNDASIVLAEGIAGTERAFAELMKAKARRLGLTGSHFTNSTGMADLDQYVTPRDLVSMAQHIIRDFPEYYAIYSEPGFISNRVRQANRNPLLSWNVGADGLTTGFAQGKGYSLVGSVVRGGRRQIFSLTGANESQRTVESRRLLDWGFGEQP